MPFAPTFDTVGVLARDCETMQRAASVLLSAEPTADAGPTAIHLVDEAFAMVDPDARQGWQGRSSDCKGCSANGCRRRRSAGSAGQGARAVLMRCWKPFVRCNGQRSPVRWAPWVATARPEFGPATAANFELVESLDRRRVGPAVRQREAIYRDLYDVIGERDLVCIPTVPASAPEKGVRQDRTGDYYRRALSLTSLAGLGRLPQVSLPLARTPASPVGLSLIGAAGQDMFVLAVAAKIEEAGCDLMRRVSGSRAGTRLFWLSIQVKKPPAVPTADRGIRLPAVADLQIVLLAVSVGQVVKAPIAVRMPRSSSGKTSGRASEKIKNI